MNSKELFEEFWLREMSPSWDLYQENGVYMCHETNRGWIAWQAAIAAIKAQGAVAWLRTSGEGSPVITEKFLKSLPVYRSDFEVPCYKLPED